MRTCRGLGAIVDQPLLDSSPSGGEMGAEGSDHCPQTLDLILLVEGLKEARS